jgi:hypothetical protein
MWWKEQVGRIRKVRKPYKILVSKALEINSLGKSRCGKEKYWISAGNVDWKLSGSRYGIVTCIVERNIGFSLNLANVYQLNDNYHARFDVLTTVLLKIQDFWDVKPRRLVDGRILSKWIFKKWEWEAWTGLFWLRLGTAGGRLWMR